MANQPHHQRRAYVLGSAQVRAAALNDPRSICWRCGLTLQEHMPHRNGKPAFWTAGHTIDGADSQPWLHPRVQPPDGPWLAAEASTCNFAAGAVAGNAARQPDTEYDW